MMPDYPRTGDKVYDCGRMARKLQPNGKIIAVISYDPREYLIEFFDEPRQTDEFTEDELQWTKDYGGVWFINQ